MHVEFKLIFDFLCVNLHILRFEAEVKLDPLPMLLFLYFLLINSFLLFRTLFIFHNTHWDVTRHILMHIFLIQKFQAKFFDIDIQLIFVNMHLFYFLFL